MGHWSKPITETRLDKLRLSDTPKYQKYKSVELGDQLWQFKIIHRNTNQLIWEINYDAPILIAVHLDEGFLHYQLLEMFSC